MTAQFNIHRFRDFLLTRTYQWMNMDKRGTSRIDVDLSLGYASEGLFVAFSASPWT
jgi:hypothetical protein